MAGLTTLHSDYRQKLDTPARMKCRDRLLPIPFAQIDAFLNAEWSAIGERLCRVLSEGDLIYELPDVFGAIQNYIKCHGLRIPKPQRIALLKLTLSMACCPNIDAVVCFQAITLSKFLLKRWKNISTKLLQLDWRDFWDMIQWLTMTLESRLELVQWPRNEVENFFEVTRLAKRFFASSSIEEIWLEFRHQIMARMLNGGQHTFDFLHILIPFFPKNFDQISQTWLPDVIDMWYILTDFGKPFHDVVGILAHVARSCRGRVDWEPHLERLFCGLLRSMTLPHGPVSVDDTPGVQIKTSLLDPYAELLANAIGPDSPGSRSTVIQRLKDFYKTMEPFYHPSNPGTSGALLVSFTNHLVNSLNSRLRDELMPAVQQAEDVGLPPVEFNLTVEQVDEVVNLLLPIVLDHMLFCKLEKMLIKVARTIDLLAQLRPSLVLPALLMRLEEGLDRLESPLRYTRPLYALCFCVASFSHVRFALYQPGRFQRSGNETGPVAIDLGDSDDESDEPNLGIDSQNQSPEEIDGEEAKVLEPAVDETPVNDDRGRDILRHLTLFSQHDQAHLKAFTYPEGRTQLVRLINILLSGFDLNHADRVYLTIACLSRLFLSTPIQDFSEFPIADLINNLDLDEDVKARVELVASSTADIEELTVRVFQRILDCLLALNDRSVVGHNVISAGSSAQPVASDGSVVLRPHAGPEGKPRVASEVCQLSGLTGLSISLAISAGPVPHLRRRLIRLLLDATFESQWEPDAARLLGYQLYWLAVKSKCSVASELHTRDIQSDISLCDTDLFALHCFWPRFMALYRELYADGSIVYRGRAEPRLLALLYVLSGLFAAIHPVKLIQPEFRQQYLEPLFSALSEILFLSSGVLTDASQPSKHSFNRNSIDSESTCACPALAEAASSLLATILYRLLNYTIDLSHVDLMQSGSSHVVPNNLFLTSAWWTPFISLRTFFEQSISFTSNELHSAESEDNCLPNFWIVPCDEAKLLADQLVRKFLLPILLHLDKLNDQLQRTCSGFSMDLTIADQRNQLSSLLIWANHLLMGLANVLSPRHPDFNGTEPDPPPPWHGHEHLAAKRKTKVPCILPPSILDSSRFSCILSNSKGEQVGLRDFIFDIGLRLLTTLAELFVRADDSLSTTPEETNGYGLEDMSDIKSKLPSSCADPHHNISLLVNCSQLDDLLRLTQCAAFNWAMNEQAPCMLLPVRGPQALRTRDLGARSCLAPHGDSVIHDLIPYLKLIPTLNSMFGISCQQRTLTGVTELDMRTSEYGRSALSWIAAVQNRHWLLVVNNLRYPLNRLAASHDPDWAWSLNIAPSPRLRQLIHVIGTLATAPRRADIRRCATNYLVTFPLLVVPQMTTGMVLRIIRRLSDAEADVKSEAVQQTQLETTQSNLSEIMFKLVQHRRRSAIALLSQIHRRIDTLRQHDEFMRLDLNALTALWTALITQAIHRPTVDPDETGQSMSLSPAEIRYRQTAQDQLERMVLDAFGRDAQLSLNFVLHFPTHNADFGIDGGWLQHVYQQVNHVLKVFHPDTTDQINTYNLQSDSSVFRVITNRRSAYKQFLNNVFSDCLSTYQNQMTVTNQKKNVAGRALVTRLLGLLPRFVDAPLNPPWKPNCIQLAPPPPPPPVAMLQVVCNLITSQQPEVAHSACTYLTHMLVLLLLRHRVPPRISIDPAAIAKQRTGAEPPTSGPPTPVPRADNQFLMFDEHARILATDEAFRQHHHIVLWDSGYIYYPPKVFIEDPHYDLAYPVFDPTTGLLNAAYSDWLKHLDESDSEQQEVRACLSFLAETLASPRDETRQFWLLLGQRVIRLHRSPTGRELFPLNLFVQTCLRAFGPDPLLHHLEELVQSILFVQPEKREKFDGITEVVAPCWALLLTLSLTSSSRRWSRPWRYYYLGRVLPRLLVMLELNALTVSTSSLAQAVSRTLVHPELSRLFYSPLRYAGNYSGLGSCVPSDISDLKQNEESNSNTPVKSSNAPTDPMGTVAQTQAGGPITRLAFAWDLLFCWLVESGEFDMSLFHPLWDWTQEGMKTCDKEAHSASQSECTHDKSISLPAGCLEVVKNDCPTCLFQRCLPIAHRRVFYLRMCTILVTYMGWKGVGLHGYLTRCLPNDDESEVSPWFRLAADDSVWIRDMAAKIAVYRACLPHSDVFHGRRVPLCLRPNGSASTPPGWLAAKSLFPEHERFLHNLLTEKPSKELLGAQFITDTYLPHLVRDTLIALQLKGYQPSTASLALRCAPPERLPRTDSSACGDLSSVLSSTVSDRDKWIALTPLANRLRCMYACLPTMLANAFPVSLCPDSEITGGMEQNRFTALRLCHLVMPLLADLCATGNLYRTISHLLGMGTFGSAGFARSSNDGTGGEVLDGVESGVSILVRRLALIPLAGQGDADSAISACLELTRPFLAHGSWKARGVGLLLLRNLVVVNLPAFWVTRNVIQTEKSIFSEVVHCLRQTLLAHLADQWIEVRQLAMCTLAVFIQIGLVDFDSQWVNQLARQAKTPYPRNLGPDAQGTPQMVEYHKAIRERHAAVLGLAAFVHAHPHTTPDYLPQIITELAGHVHDPQPVGKTVSDTLSAYSRNHQDSWHEHRTKFTEQQLEEYLSVVSAAAYYV